MKYLAEIGGKRVGTFPVIRHLMELERKVMKPKLQFASLVCILISAMVAAAGQPPRTPVWYEGHRVTMIVVNDNVVGVERDSLEHIANPLYSFGPPGNQPQADVISVAPGESGYTPWWEVIRVVVTNGRDVSTDPFTSEDEILEAEESGDVELVETEFYFLCQIIFGGKR